MTTKKNPRIKTVILLSSSSAISLSITMEDRSENHECRYFPGSRKDASCICKICLASISATLDLMPLSIQRSSLMNLSASKSKVEVPMIAIVASGFSASLARTARIGNEIFSQERC
ncbi:hypothetical protein NE237_021852 [Protea cynaroides]|uniref:Uncharacterized protein n=1 Tax=Protea cynaroides TaxID=273540 RepID=A0A9Q0H8R6_9MAGN|nr:hypothetical protein NE237_021852 [Protea cynaroides]